MLRSSAAAGSSSARGGRVTARSPFCCLGGGSDDNVNASQILTVDKSRLVKRLGSLSAERRREVDRAIKISLSLE